ncbi:hypothetical protein BH20ACT14_BH20ACT14_05590 [soil metagenome]
MDAERSRALLELCEDDRGFFCPQTAGTFRRADRAVHLDHVAAPGPAVQCVDVLRDDRRHETTPLELREREMTRVRLCLEE